MATLGIDLGTSHSSLAFIHAGEARLLDIPQLENARDLYALADVVSNKTIEIGSPFFVLPR